MSSKPASVKQGVKQLSETLSLNLKRKKERKKIKEKKRAENVAQWSITPEFNPQYYSPPKFK